MIEDHANRETVRNSEMTTEDFVVAFIVEASRQAWASGRLTSWHLGGMTLSLRDHGQDWATLANFEFPWAGDVPVLA